MTTTPARTLPFIKMHGIGNDYVYIDAIRHPWVTTLALDELSRAMSDRHTGVGSDGLIVVTAADVSVDAHVRMRMFNADGSESEMCGNGIRCVAKLAHDHELCDAQPMRVQTGRGVLSISYEVDATGRLSRATVDMGTPILDPASIPVTLSGVARVIDVDAAGLLDFKLEGDPDWVDACGLESGMTCVSMGNPHVVMYVRDVGRVPLAAIGPRIEHASIFPNRTNVHFVEVQATGECTMRTWERGSGETRACGTGACAVCVAGVLTGRTERCLLAHLPGGNLLLEWDALTDHVRMTGDATEVFTGQWILA